MRLLLLGLLLAPASAQAGFFSSAGNKGTTSGQFLTLGAGARGAAMGGAYTAAVADASALYWNPAAMSRVPGASLIAMHAAHVDSSAYDYLAYAHRLGGFGMLGMGVQSFQSGRIAGFDAGGNETGSFSTGDLAVTVGHSYELKDATERKLLAVGAAAKLVRSKLATTAQTWAYDFGLLTAPLLDERLRLGATASNLGGRLTYDRDSAPLPVLLKAGAAYNLTENWLASLDAGFPNDNDPFGALGTAYLLAVSEGVRLTARAGVNSQALREGGSFGGASGGLGIMVGRWGFDYAFAPVAAMGMTHRLSLAVTFGAD